MTVVLAGGMLAFLVMVAWTWASTPVSFDGGINLQVAQNMADGAGYARNYQGLRYFPSEVATNVPYVLPATAIFALFGVNLVTAQLTNIVYLALFAVALFVFLGRSMGMAWASFAVLATFAAPGMMIYGGNGYGELVALFWWLLGTLILFSGSPPPSSRDLFLCGVCFGLSVATKTVLAIGVGSTGLILCLYSLQAEGLSRNTLQRILFVAAGFAVPLAAIEAWRWLALGNSATYLDWWQFQFVEIGEQAGVVEHFQDTPGVWAKGAKHFVVLSNYLQLNPALAAVWLLFPCLVCSLYAFSPRKELKWLVLSILLCAVAYMTWWLFVTPSMKAWPRRIFNGVVLINLLWVFACYAGNAVPFLARRSAAVLSALSILAACAFFVHGGLQAFSSKKPALEREFARAVEALESAPGNAPIFGKGWYSSPVLALYSGRTVTDINTVPAAELEKQTAAYLAIDPPAIAAKAFDIYLRRFQHRAVLIGQWFQVYEVDFSSRLDWTEPFRNPDASLKHDIEFAGETYAPAIGLFDDHWASMDTELLLAPVKASEVRLTVYRPMVPYLFDRPLTITAYLEGCELGSNVVPTDRVTTLTFKVPATCALGEGQPLVLRLISDNISRGDSRWGIESRQLSYILTRVALVPG
ncbi:ArnT family glycosyltransferase [Methyloceanibacter sp.]|uniref:ArnT family glycosyltransferase n=1 Tax=Methyloceanibacter sp. TaxID=1965321 RepID=UPI003D6D937E